MCSHAQRLPEATTLLSLPFMGVAEQIHDFLNARLGQAFALSPKCLGYMNNCIGHPLMRFLRTAIQNVMLSGGYADVAVLIVQADTNQADQFLGFSFLRPRRLSSHCYVPLYCCRAVDNISDKTDACQP